ncbi:MAG: SPASM domain-containing protein, partial [Candidatus Woesearchaeota archaeon]
TRWNNKEIQSATNLSEKLGIALFIRIVEYQPCYTSRLSKRKQMCHEPGKEALRKLMTLKGMCTNPTYIQSVNKRVQGMIGCHVRHKSLFISLGGNAYLCRKKQQLGNLQEATLSDIIGSKSYRLCLAEMRHCQDAGCFEYISE